MLAFVLVLVLMASYLIARSVNLADPDIQEEQSTVRERIELYKKKYPNIEVRKNGTIQNITFGSDITFEPGSAKLSSEGVRLMKEIANTIIGEGKDGRLEKLDEIQVSGHTDNVPISNATYSSNWELSTARARRVTNSLIQGGVDPDSVTMSATGYAQYEPRASNENSQGRQRNRRIEMRLIYSGSAEENPSRQ
jgi:chemotaxis protein MotB